jgi:hypothetical protein
LPKSDLEEPDSFSPNVERQSFTATYSFTTSVR